MLKRIIKTYSISFHGYIVKRGQILTLFTTTNRNEVENLCKEFSLSFNHHVKIYVEEVYMTHSTSIFKL